jgi:hypothetical protein
VKETERVAKWTLSWELAIENATAWPSPGKLMRMALRAHQRGIVLAAVEVDGRVEHYALDPVGGDRHYLTGFSCDCGLFARCGACPHLALLLIALGWIPESVADGNGATV